MFDWGDSSDGGARIQWEEVGVLVLASETTPL